MRHYFDRDNKPEPEYLETVTSLFDSFLDNLGLEKVSSTCTSEGVLLDSEVVKAPFFTFIRYAGSSLVSPKNWKSLEDLAKDITPVMEFMGRGMDEQVLAIKEALTAPLHEVLTMMNKPKTIHMTYGNLHAFDEVTMIAHWRLNNAA
jgi:hypothetical protein